MLHANLPSRINRHALEDRSERLRNTVADDKDANNPQRNREPAAHEENAMVEIQQGTFYSRDSGTVNHFSAQEQLQRSQRTSETWLYLLDFFIWGVSTYLCHHRRIFQQNGMFTRPIAHACESLS